MDDRDDMHSVTGSTSRTQLKLTLFYVVATWFMAIASLLGLPAGVHGDGLLFAVFAATQLACMAAFAWSLVLAAQAWRRGAEKTCPFCWPLGGLAAVVVAILVC